jgi:hypothetical protein
VPLDELNTNAYEGGGSTRDARRQLFFDRETTTGQYDIYLVTREQPSGPFGAPVLVGVVNSGQSDVNPWVSPDLHTIFFASVRTGDMEIFEATR